METFVKVMFWVSVAGFIINGLILGFDDMPKNEKRGIGFYCIRCIESAVFAFWTGILIWWK